MNPDCWTPTYFRSYTGNFNVVLGQAKKTNSLLRPRYAILSILHCTYTIQIALV